MQLACAARLVQGGGMFGLGTGELLVIGFVLVVIFSASRMGQLGNALGKFVYSFKKASQGQDLVDVNPKRDKRG